MYKEGNYKGYEWVFNGDLGVYFHTQSLYADTLEGLKKKIDEMERKK